MSILSTIIEFLDHEKAGIASKVIASASYDFLKKHLNFSSLKGKISGFFQKEEIADQFIAEICNTQGTTNALKDIDQTYFKLTGDDLPVKLISMFEEWFTENKEIIKEVNNISVQSSSGFIIGSQSAGHDVINIQGDYTINNKNDKG